MTRENRNLIRAAAIIALCVPWIAHAEPTCKVEQAGDLTADAVRACLLQMAEQAKPNCGEMLRFYHAAGALQMRPKLRAVLAECHQELGQKEEALAQVKSCLEEAKENDALAAEPRARCEKVKTEIEQNQGYVTVHVKDRPPGVQVIVASKVLPESSYDHAMRLDAGSVSVDAFAPGREIFSKSIEVKAGGQISVDVELKPLQTMITSTAPLSTPLPTAPVLPDRTWRWTGLITGGAGIVSISVGAILGGVAVEKNNESNEKGHCGGDLCDKTGLELRSQVVDLGNAATAAFLAGGLLLTGGFVLLAIAPSGESKKQGATKPKDRWNAVVQMSPGGFGVTGTW